MHPLLTPPPLRRLQSEFRLPMLQPLTETIAGNLQRTLQDRDSLRRIKTTRGSSRIALGPLPAIQRFVLEDVGYTNTADSMRSGLRARNAPRVADKTRGQSAGI